MTKTRFYTRARDFSGIVSGFLGVTGICSGSMTALGLALFFAATWLLFCLLSVNVFIEDEVDRIAPRKGQHRRNQ